MRSRPEVRPSGESAPAVREHRRKRLQQEHDARMAALDDMDASVPDLNAVMMVRVSGDVMPGGQVG